MGFATTVLRLVTGATMAGHGLQKLTTSFGEGGLDASGGSFEQMGFKPGRPFALATGTAETVGGSLMVLGLGTPFACSLVTGVHVGAIAKVHFDKGFWVSKGGFEYNLHLLAATFAIAGTGGGALTLDALRGKKHRGFGWAVAQLALGAAGAAAALAIAERQGREETESHSDRYSQAQPAQGARSREGGQPGRGEQAGTGEQRDGTAYTSERQISAEHRMGSGQAAAANAVEGEPRLDLSGHSATSSRPASSASHTEPKPEGLGARSEG